MDSRWISHFSPSDDEMLAIVEEHTSIEVHDLHLLGEGWDFRNYLVNGEWVFRHPKRYSESDTLLREKSILDSLQIPLQHPVVKFWIPQPDPLKVPLVGYRYIRGEPLVNFSREDVDLAAMGKILGTTLSVLHRHPKVGKALRTDPLNSWVGDRGSLKSDELPVAKKYLDANCYSACEHAINQYQSRRLTDDLVMAHNDLGVEHVLLNGAMEVCAIIDWADAHIASRYVDFAGLWGWGGDAIVKQMLVHYPVQPSIANVGQMRAHGLCYALGQILDGDRLENEFLKMTAIDWIRERHRDGSLIDIYAPFDS